MSRAAEAEFAAAQSKSSGLAGDLAALFNGAPRSKASGHLSCRARAHAARIALKGGAHITRRKDGSI